MLLAPKSPLGTYEILSHLGTGGMGEVYRARDTRLGRDVAVKVLPAAVAASPDHLTRFEREARAVAALNHPNIVTLYSIEEEGGVRFLTMELVEGQNLKSLVTPGGLPLSRILEISIPLAEALVAAHTRGVVH
ncbi:MAG: serine/threonine-protein kinase, partial [Candidatus Eiseniibacteriota bacterium]